MIVTIIGARPQFVKAAVVSRALKKEGITETIVHTGQHYDEKMSDVFWSELGIPQVAANLEVGSGLQGLQTAKIIEKFEAFLLNQPSLPKAVLVYGDTNSTLAASIVASKLNIPIIHVEAGLRSFNRDMPEEINRIVTDHLSSILFCSSDKGVEQLAREGITKNVYNVGDVMYDALVTFGEMAEELVDISNFLPFTQSKFGILTLHRPANAENTANLLSILQAVVEIDLPVVWPLHPRIKEKIKSFSIPANVHLIEPLSYFEMLSLLKKCHTVLTDSGGLQKETYWMRKPCITLREETEWTETLHNDWNVLAGADCERIVNAASRSVSEETWFPIYGNGEAAVEIVKIIQRTAFN